MKKSMSRLTGLSVVVLVLIVVLACSPVFTATPAAPSKVATATAPAATPELKQIAPTLKPVTPAVKSPKTDEAPYYEKKTIEIIVESAAGGGTDTTARIVAPFLNKHIPGNPRIVVRNQPGAAGVNANNIFYEKAKPDGLTLLFNSTSPISMTLRSRDVVKFDLLKYKYVGNVSRGEALFMIRKGSRARLADPKAPPLVIGSKEGEETALAIPMWGKEFLGWNVRWVLGYGGTSETELAFMRGELDTVTTKDSVTIKRLERDGLAEALCAMGGFKGGKFVRRVDFPDVPTFEELLGDKKPTGLPWQAFLVWAGPAAVDKFLVAPPGTPDNIVAILTDAFVKMAGDPEFDRMVKKTMAEVYEVGIGKEVEAMVRQVVDTPSQALVYAVELQKKFGIIAK